MNQLTLTGVHLNIGSQAVRQARKRRRRRRRRRIVGQVELLKGNFVDDDATELGSVVVMRHHEEVILPYQGSTQATSYVVLCYSIVCQACLEEGKCTPTAADIADAAMLPPPVAL